MPAHCPSPTEIPLELTNQQVRDLALLNDAPRGVAESTMALLRFGARTLFEELGLIAITEEQPRRIEISEEGWRVIQACAQWVEYATEEDWKRCRGVEQMHMHAG